MGAWAVPRRYLPLPMHQRRRLLAAVACYQAARATTIPSLPSQTLALMLHAWLHEAPCSGRHPQTDPHQWVLGPCPGGTSRCPCINGGACWRRWRVIKPHVQPQFHPCPLTGVVAWIGCMKRLAQGVIRRRIRTNGCLGRAQEVPPAAHASTEALACGGGVLSSRTCNHNSILALSDTGVDVHGCMKRLAQVRHPQTDPHQWVLGPCPGGTSRCPCINGGACLRRWRVIKPHVQPQFHPCPLRHWR